MKTKLTLSILFLIPFTFSQVQAQSSSDDWEFIVAPYALLANIQGVAGVGRAESIDVDVDFGTLLDNLQLGGMIHGEIRKGSWGVIMDLAFMNLGTSETIPIGSVIRADVDQLVFESFLAYRKESSRGFFEVMGGIRVINIGVQLELDGLLVQDGRVNRGETWIDPAIGARGLVKLSDRFFLTGRIDIGGFGVGDSFAWNVQGGVGFDLTKHVFLFGGYRSLDLDFETGQPGRPDYFLYDTNTHGAMVGVGFRF